jgi:hypothetical protein
VYCSSTAAQRISVSSLPLPASVGRWNSFTIPEAFNTFWYLHRRSELSHGMVVAVLEGALSGFGTALYSEYALLVVLFGLVASHGAYFGRRLVELAEARKEAGTFDKAQMLALRRRRLQRLSFGLSMLNILISAAVMILAAYARVG